jgi:thiol-disulfide isomerase/thioredoxin
MANSAYERKVSMGIQSMVTAAVLTAVCLMGLPLRGHSADESTVGTPVTLADAGRAAPNFVGIETWLNSGPLNIADLRGKVVLVDFWTYGCINCARTLPHVTKLYDAYRNRGLIVVGIHSPEFPFEKATSNVQTAIKRFGIKYPVGQDNELTTWNAYHNQYWPAQYIVDKSGKIVFEHAGEGQYEEIERKIKELLNANS